MGQVNDDTVKDLCEQLYQHEKDGFHFNYVFDKSIVMGCVLDISRYGIKEGTRNNIIGDQNQCANLFYSQILLYGAQIKDILGYSSEELVSELCRRLRANVHEFDNIPAVIGFKKEPI